MGEPIETRTTYGVGPLLAADAPLTAEEMDEIADACRLYSAEASDGIAGHGGPQGWSPADALRSAARDIARLLSALRAAEARAEAAERALAAAVCELGRVADPRLADVKPVALQALARAESRPFTGKARPLTNAEVSAVLTEFRALAAAVAP